MKRSYESEPINDKHVAWDAAHAQKPYWEIAAAARGVGNKSIAEITESRGRIAVQLVELSASKKGQFRERFERKLALSVLLRNSEEDVLTKNDFVRLNQTRGAEIWDALLAEHLPVDSGAPQDSQAETPPPIRFHEYHPGHFVLMGDLTAAAAATEDQDLRGIYQYAIASIAAAAEQQAIFEAQLLEHS